MRRLLPIVLLLALLGAFAAACRGGGSASDDHIAAVIHRLLVSSGSSDTASLESFTGRLPEGITVDVPAYPGADLVVSSRRPASGASLATPDASGNIAQPMLYFIVYDTQDERQKVLEYYQDALDRDPWRLDTTFSTTELDSLQFTMPDDADIAGAVSIAHGGGDGHTSILISLQDAGAFRRELPPYDLAESLPPPKGFPTDVPIYTGATIISSALLRQSSDNFLVDFITKDSADDVMTFYQQAFAGLGWTVQSGAPLGVQQRLDFHDAGNTVQGDLIVDRFPADPTFTEVKLQVAVSLGATPSSITPVPTPPPAPTNTPRAAPTPAATR